MTSSRPYLIRALYEWIADNGMTPHLLVDATTDGVEVPSSAVQEGKVTLNVGMSAVAGLSLENELIEFQARFSGVSQRVRVPPAAVLAIYARESGQGMMFPPEGESPDPGPGSPSGQEDNGDDDGGGRGSHLRVVK